MVGGVVGQREEEKKVTHGLVVWRDNEVAQPREYQEAHE
jgi:hypothetical protein